MNFLQKRLTRCLPIITVHSWGGFGSQLFTAHFVLRLKKKFPHRRIQVAIHTAGVTQRHAEINFEDLGVKVFEIDDYHLSSETKPKSETCLYLNKLTDQTIAFFKALVLKIHLIGQCNTEASFKSIKPWTLQFRGHYTRLQLDAGVVQSLFWLIFSDYVFNKQSLHSLILHYRLGDLLHLDSKSPVNPMKIETLLQNLKVHIESAVALTDGEEREYKDFVFGYSILSSLRVQNLDPTNSLCLCISSQEFIGTEAKLSLWAAIFRKIIFKKPSFLPFGLDWAEEIGLAANWY